MRATGKARGLVALAALLSLPAYAQGEDERLVTGGESAIGLTRSVADMQCMDTTFGDFVCYKMVGNTLLSVEASKIDTGTNRRLQKHLSTHCKGPETLDEDQCTASISFVVGSVERNSQRLEAGKPLQRRMVIKTAAILLKR